MAGPNRALVHLSVLVIVLVVWFWRTLTGAMTVRTIPYSEFKTHLSRHEVVESAIKEEEITGRLVPMSGAVSRRNRQQAPPQTTEPCHECKT